MAGSINTQEYELFPRHDRRKFFYGKAKEIYYDDGTVELRSYSTIVAKIPPPPSTPEVYGWYSDTTGRHIKEFLKQHGFKAENKSQILKDYYKEKNDVQF